MGENKEPNRNVPEPVDLELKKIQDKQLADMKKARLTNRAQGGPPMPGPPKGKPMNEQQAMAQTVMANANGIRQLNDVFKQFSQHTEQNIMVTQRAVQNLARPDLILGPVIEQWHNGPHPDMILMVKEGMRIVAVGNVETMDEKVIIMKSDQGMISIPREYVLMEYHKEEGVLYGQARRDSEAAASASEESSEKPEDPSVETKKG